MISGISNQIHGTRALMNKTTPGLVENLKINACMKYMKYFRAQEVIINVPTDNLVKACRAGSDGSMSASGSAGPGFDPWRGSKFSFGARRGGDVHFLITRLYITGLD